MILQTARVISGMFLRERTSLMTYKYVVQHWLQLQNDYRCFFYVADLQSLACGEEVDNISAQTLVVIKDWLAMGVNPEQVTIFVQSAVPGYTELYFLLSMLMPIISLKNTYDLDNCMYGSLGMPILQAVDIFLYKPSFLIEDLRFINLDIVREIAKRFNKMFSSNTRANYQIEDILHKPKYLEQYSDVQTKEDCKLEMYNKLHFLMEPEALTNKILSLAIDPKRSKRTEGGDPQKCSVWPLHKMYSSSAVLASIETGCRTAGIGCLECKQCLIDSVLAEQGPVLERRKEYDMEPRKVHTIIKKGNEEARDLAAASLRDIRRTMGLKAQWLIK